ncbi:MAG: CRISPR-associated endoribonuclease Cas6 [Candidatus Bipolaricaulota bacterium]|nr:CRISPR-associated endoribonuclease Cas6 [Candidatus Bipolaricaulota bacterium]MDW8127521.1 CRISPR-associated endoribonuclease Cas6 [Candidatus Bipolaricaulota bacterium]
MQIEVVLVGSQGELRLPQQYNEVLQGFLYRNLATELGQMVHDQGFADPQNVKRRLKLFTFSRLFGYRQEEGEAIVFRGPVRWVVASPWAELLSAWAEKFLKTPELELYGQPVRLSELRVLPAPEYGRPVRVVALSPITVYRTLSSPDGKRKTYYFAPFEREFSTLILANLARKVRAWTGKEVQADGAVRPLRVTKRNEHILLYKGTVIKAWSGVYELELPEELFLMAFDAGLGAKNSQGFGCIGLWRERKRNVKEVHSR